MHSEPVRIRSKKVLEFDNLTRRKYRRNIEAIRLICAETWFSHKCESLSNVPLAQDLLQSKTHLPITFLCPLIYEGSLQ